MSHESAQPHTVGPPDTRMARRAYVAAGIGWGLDGLTWTIYGFALTAVGPALGFDTEAAGWITAISIMSSALGGAIGGMLADRFGRARTLVWVIVGYCLFTGLSATAQDMWQFLGWRVLEGFTFGAEWAVGAALVAEYAPAHRRGRVLSAIHSCYAIGWAVSTGMYLWIFSVAEEHLAWRYLFLVGVVPGLVALWIRRNVRDRIPASERRTERPPLALLFSPELIRTTMLATALGVGVQGIYYSVFVFLPSYLKEERGLAVVGTASYTWVVIAGSFLGYFLSGYVHDWIGRRRAFALFFVAAVASIALFVLTPAAQPELAYLISFALGFFASGQAGGLGAYLAELFPTEVRASGQGFSYNVGRGIAAFGPLSVGLFTATIGLGTAILAVGLVAATVALIAIGKLPETKNTEIVH